LATSEYRLLTNDSTIEYEAHWLPNQDKILYGTLEGDRIPEFWPFGVGNLFLLDSQASELTLIADGYYESIALSPDGRQIAFGGDSLCLLDLETGQETCDILGEGLSGYDNFQVPAWSSSGIKLAFRASIRGDYCQKVFILDLINGEVAAVGEEGCNTSALYWSPTAP
jgi:Tol biopolymer transport system component